MTSITKEFSWAMAHRLEKHDGLCSNLHGHTWKLFVTIVRIDENLFDGMVWDFSDLKHFVNKLIIDKLDHSFAYNRNDKDSKLIAKYLTKHIHQKVIIFNFRVTSENLIEWIVNTLNIYLKDTNFKCIKGVLYENETSCATYKVKFYGVKLNEKSNIE
jgi:6-pyruvoyltetrahydropterin/6-carboxytetrahydropterin synthase